MKKLHKQVVVIGAGPAGLAAAAALRQSGVEDLLVLEREQHTGGILRQCIHDGFGLTRFGEALTGPEYAQRFIDLAAGLDVPIQTGCTVLKLTADRTLTAASPEGLLQLTADAVVLAMGCRERTRGALSIPGRRPAGVFTAGVAQAYVNLKNTMIGRRAVILGSGDIGMIMARRLTLEGVEIPAVFEIQPYPSGLPRNIQQCLNDFGIPLHLSHTVTAIHGAARLEGVTVSQVDEKLRPVPGTERLWPCDTLILSVGLIPENELTKQAGAALDGRTRGAIVDEHYQTGVPGVFAAGNVLHVHDLADHVSLEAERLAAAVCRYLDGGLPACDVAVEAGEGVGYTVPQRVSAQEDTVLSFRPWRPIQNCTFQVVQDGVVLAKKKLRRALPAEMVQIPVRAEAFVSRGPVRVEVRP